MEPSLLASQTIVTHSSGVHGIQVSEMAITLMLLLAKRAQLVFDQKRDRIYEPFAPMIISSKTLTILGLGAIGKEVARLAKAFKMKVIAIDARTVSSEYADLILPTSRLHEALAQGDFVVLALPLMPETENLIGEPEFHAMKPTAYLVNIARGGIIDEDALVRALKEKWIAGAGLDAFVTVPLPPESKLWDLPNAILTPHIAGRRNDYDVLTTNLFCKNLKLYLSGKKLFNVVA
jgi:phosphoglycerate dehydrogenase-like enzyme